MEKLTEVSTYRVRMMCDKCEGGEMVSTGASLMSNPPQYIHRCNGCGYETSYLGGKNYPYIKYAEVE